MKLVVFGMLNKQVGLKLGISEITVKAHRGKMMHKMKATKNGAKMVAGCPHARDYCIVV